MDSGVKRPRGGLKRALIKLPENGGPPDANLRLAETSAYRLRYKIVEGNHSGLVTRRVQVREIVADSVDRRRVGIQA